MDEKTARLLELWNEREQRFNDRIAGLKARGATVNGDDQASRDLINTEAKLAELTECRSEFKAAFVVSGSGA